MSIRIDDIEGLDFSDVADMSVGKLAPILPGEILMEEFLRPMGITQYRLAKEINVSARRIGEIVSGKRAITADTGLRLSRFFGMNDGFWISLQAEFDMVSAREAMGDTLGRIKRFEVTVVVNKDVASSHR